MDSWNYQDYLNSVQKDMVFGIESRKYDIEEAFGFAHEELSLRLEEFPEETPLALTALAVCLNGYGKLSMFSSEDDFISEINIAYEPNQLQLASAKLDPKQTEIFSSDVELVKDVLGI